MIKEAIVKLVKKNNLAFAEAKGVFNEMFTDKTTPAQIAAFLTALAMKGETEHEIAALATVVRHRAAKLKIHISGTDIPLLDTCGTGGSGVNKFNISTAVAFVVSAAGINVAKHGNRAMSSYCGSADVIEALGIPLDRPPSVIAEAIKKVGIGFLFAPLYHPALRQVAVVRKEIGIRTIFNLVGPLCNPALATHQLLGVHDKALVPTMAKVLKIVGVKKAMVVFGKDLKDEVSLTGETVIALLNNRRIRYISVNPADFGLKIARLKDLFVTDVHASQRVIEGVLAGKKGPCRDVVLANASCCLYLAGRVRDFKEGTKLAAALIDEGKAKQKLADLRNFFSSKNG